MGFLSLLPAPRKWSAILMLALSPTMGVAGEAAADYYVRDLPGVPKDTSPIKMHAGHIEVTPEHNGNLFFWHFQNRHIAAKQRTVIWLNGGPGCSSEDGALMEIGPYRLKNDTALELNNGSWNEFANLLFVDNPVGTGFSFTDTDSFVSELDEMADQFVQFLEKWFALFPQYNSDDLYLSGESYAGQHIPYIAKAILERNKKTKKAPWNLRGLMIGNGWISPYTQYESYITFAVEKGLLKKDSEVHKTLMGQLRVCERFRSTNPGHIDYPECEEILSNMLKMLKNDKGDENQACINMYDVRLKDAWPSCGMNWPPDLKHVTPYLRNPDVVTALHVSPNKNTGWQECTGAVGQAFKVQNSTPSVDLLPNILTEVPILLFSGAEDLICNHFGTESLIDKLEWNGGKGFEVTPGNWAPRRDWTFEGQNAGFWQEARNLTYVLFHNASHMVPFDWPRRSRDMLDRFMKVDISSIGGSPTDSRIDGEKMLETTVGGASNKTQDAADAEQKKLDDAKWAAYQKSGEIVLTIVIVASLAWGYFIWRERRKRSVYQAVASNDSSGRLNGLRTKRTAGDLEAAALGENELDDLRVKTPTLPQGSKYSVGDDSDESEEEPEEEEIGRRKRGSSSRA